MLAKFLLASKLLNCEQVSAALFPEPHFYSRSERCLSNFIKFPYEFDMRALSKCAIH